MDKKEHLEKIRQYNRQLDVASQELILADVECARAAARYTGLEAEYRACIATFKEAQATTKGAWGSKITPLSQAEIEAIVARGKGGQDSWGVDLVPVQSEWTDVPYPKPHSVAEAIQRQDGAAHIATSCAEAVLQPEGGQGA